MKLLIETRFIIIGLLFIVSVLSGINISKSGKPYNVPVFTIHKIAGLAAIVLIAIAIYKIQEPIELKILELGAIVFTGIFLVSVFISGVLLSINKTVNELILTIHKITWILSMVFTIITVYLLGTVL